MLPKANDVTYLQFICIYSYTMHWDNQFYKATSSFRNSADQVILSSRPFTVPDSNSTSSSNPAGFTIKIKLGTLL